MKLGVIDLGTNTFHLLIVQVKEDNSFVELYRERVYVQLADEGIATIGPNSYARALAAMLHYAEILEQFEVIHVKAFGTAALRRASNGRSFIKEVFEKTNLQIDLISGDREAQLICEGVRRAIPMTNDIELIMDIGGGSVEFILANQHTVFWAKSFPIGVAVLFNDFHHTDPITKIEKERLYAHLQKVLAPLIQATKQYPATRLVGASGTFDVLEEILSDGRSGPHYATFPAASMTPIYDIIVPSTLQERLEMPQIPDKRAKLITVAMILLDFVRREVGIQDIAVSAFAMKEGILSEMLSETMEV